VGSKGQGETSPSVQKCKKVSPREEIGQPEKKRRKKAVVKKGHFLHQKVGNQSPEKGGCRGWEAHRPANKYH